MAIVGWRSRSRDFVAALGTGFGVLNAGERDARFVARYEIDRSNCDALRGPVRRSSDARF